MPAAVAIPVLQAVLPAAATVTGGVMASRSAGKAAKYTAQSDSAALREAMAQRQEDQRRWEAEQANRQREMAVADEERLFNRKLLEQREARQAPYREASAQALKSLGGILGFDPSAGPSALNGAWLSPSQVGRRKPAAMGDVLGMR